MHLVILAILVNLVGLLNLLNLKDPEISDMLDLTFIDDGKKSLNPDRTNCCRKRL